jgi:hypothetical protein
MYTIIPTLSPGKGSTASVFRRIGDRQPALNRFVGGEQEPTHNSGAQEQKPAKPTSRANASQILFERDLSHIL